jgi:peptidylprolyl isomerase|tara:strand:- start:590 stop:1156 length:567 start_codon:yes stop_codon:yes gene_type:complete
MIIKIKKRTAIFITGIILLIVIIGAIKMTDSNNSQKVKLETNHGDIVIELYAEMPVTAGNFKKLVGEGVYDGVIFHRIIDGFMLQGGDPTGTGMGDPKIPNIQDEFTNSDLDKNNRGTISMANAGPNTGSSQFFLNLVDNNFLDGKHPVFGKIADEASLAVIDKIAKVQTNAQDKPLEDVVIVKASLV